MLQASESTEPAFLVTLLAGCIAIVWFMRQPHAQFRRKYPNDFRPQESALTVHFMETLGVVGAAAPLIGLFLCLAISLRYNFKSVTDVHSASCKIRSTKPINFLPSISASIGDHTPQRYIWRICITFMMQQRFLNGVADFNHLVATFQK